MTYQTIEFNVKEELASIVFNRPDSFNAINEPMLDELLHAIYSCTADSVRAVYITGHGKAFCSGGDVKTFAEMLRNPDPTTRRFPDKLHQIAISLRRLSKPVIAAVNGVAAGAGFSLTMACDFIVASEAAAFNLAYGRIGLSPDGSSTFFLPRLVGSNQALYMMYMGNTISAQEAKQLGIVQEIYPTAEFAEKSLALARKLAQGPTRMMGKAKQLVNQSLGTALETQVSNETDAICEIIQTADFKEGVTAFIEKRSPNFRGK